MYKLIIYILPILLLSCSKVDKKSVQLQLVGQWVYQPEPIFGDTLVFEINDNFADEFSPEFYLETKLYKIKTDSGVYEHRYYQDSLMNISLSKEVWIREISFYNDTTGILSQYSLDTTKGYLNHPNDIIDDIRFYFYLENNTPILILKDDLYQDTLKIKLFNDKQFIFIGSNKIYSKLNYHPY